MVNVYMYHDQSKCQSDIHLTYVEITLFGIFGCNKSFTTFMYACRRYLDPTVYDAFFLIPYSFQSKYKTYYYHTMSSRFVVEDLSRRCTCVYLAGVYIYLHTDHSRRGRILQFCEEKKKHDVLHFSF